MENPREPLSPFEQGNEFAKKGLFEDAIIAFREAVRLNERDAEARFNLAFCLRKKGAETEATREFQAAFALDPFMKSHYKLYGPVLKARKTPAAPAPAPPAPPQQSAAGFVVKRTRPDGIEETVELSSEEAAKLMMGMNAVVAGRGYGQADVFDFQKLLKDVKQDDPAALNNKGVELLNTKHYAGAVALFDRAIDCNREFSAAWSNKATALYHLKRFQEALNCYERAVDLTPRSGETWFSKGMVEKHLQVADKAVQSFTFLLALAPGQPRIQSLVPRARGEIDELAAQGSAKLPVEAFGLMIKGYELASDEKYREGLELLQRSGRMVPRCALPWQYQALCHNAEGRVDEALFCYGRAIAIDPANAVYRYNKGVILSRLKKYDEAIVDYSRAVELDPQYVEAWNNAGKALGVLRRYEEALFCLDKALQYFPLSDITWLNKALTEDEMGRRDEAVRSYRKFLQFAVPAREQQLQVARKRLAEIEQQRTPAPAAVPSVVPAPVPAPVKTYSTGDRIGNQYEVLRVLGGAGRSGMGIVYVCLEVESREPLVLKTFQDGYLSAEVARNSFRKSALAWIQLGKHPNIVRALWFKELDGRMFIGLEYVPFDIQDRNTLARYLSSPVPPARALGWAIQFCRGMEHARSRGVLPHRDIKPDNIMITPGGALKITDFDLAGLWDKADVTGFLRNLKDEDLTQLTFIRVADGHIVCGTPPWMAPEQFDGTTNTRSDIYSFGIVLYQLAAKGNLPYAPGAGGDWASVHRRSEPVPLSCPFYPVIARCLQKRPEDRYPDFGGLLQDLEALYEKTTGEQFPPLPQASALGAQDHLARALSLINLGFKDEAMKELQQALRIDPLHADAQYHLALLKNEKPGGGAGPAGRARAKELSAQGLALKNKGQAGEAIQQFREALACDPGFADARYLLGQTLSAAGKTDEAIAEYEELIRTRPEYRFAYYSLGIALNKAGALTKAISAFEAFLSHATPQDAEWAKKAGEGIAYLRKKLKDRDDANAARFNKGCELLNNNSFDEALAEFHAILESAPEHIQARIYQGIALEKKGLPAEAEAAFREALARDPANEFARTCLGNLFAAQGNHGGAMKEYLGDLLDKDKLAQADRSLQALSMQPRTAAEAHYKEGVSWRLMMQLDRAISEFKEALRLKPDYADARDALREALEYQEGMESDIRKNIAETMEKGPPNADALCKLGMNLIWQGKIDEGRRFLEQYLIVAPQDDAMRDTVEEILKPPAPEQQDLRPPAHTPSLVVKQPAGSKPMPLPMAGDDAEKHFLQGCVLRVRGLEEEARVEFQTAVRLNPKHEKALAALEVREEKGWSLKIMAVFVVALFIIPPVGIVAGIYGAVQKGPKKTQGYILLGLGSLMLLRWLM